MTEQAAVEVLEPVAEKPKAVKAPKRDLANELDDLKLYVDKLEALIVRVCHYTGQHNTVVNLGFTPFTPGKKSRYDA